MSSVDGAKTDLFAVTVNVGSGPGNTSARTRAMIEWVKEVAQVREPAFVFAQEVTEAWVDAWDPSRYHVAKTVGQSWRIRSALLFHRDLRVRTVPRAWAPNLASYHGSYLSAGRWETARGEVVVVSVHASPSLAALEKYNWQGSHDLPVRCGGGDPRWPAHRLWDSDAVLATLGELSRHRPVLAAGDFNESLRDDFWPDGSRRGTWATEYFARVERLGFVAPLHLAWPDETPTRDGLQLEHVLVSANRADLVANDPPPAVDPQWQLPSTTNLSDHAAVWFTVTA